MNLFIPIMMAQPLKLTDNRKTSFKPNHMNTFGLMYGRPEDGGTCPGSTQGTGGCLEIKTGRKLNTCYMAKITTIYPNVRRALEANGDLLKDKTQEEMEEVLAATVEAFIKKNKGEKLFFRLHYSGDFETEDYVKAWANVMKKYSQVRFWAYTRSYWFAKHFRDIPNLTLFLSADPVNYRLLKAVYEKHSDQKNFGIAWMGNTPPTEQRWVTCPEITGKVKNTKEGGACSKCRLCVNNYKDKVKHIHFPIH